jgi:hypothetical protein
MINQILSVMLIFLSLIFGGILFIGLVHHPNLSSLSDEERNALNGSNLNSTSDENVGEGYSTLGSNESEENLTINESELGFGEEIPGEEYPGEELPPEEYPEEEIPSEGELPPEEAENEVCPCMGDLLDCTDFVTLSEAQACFEFCGGSANDVHQLDENGDGIVCESIWAM